MPQKGGRNNYTVESFRGGGDSTIIVPISGQVGGQAAATDAAAQSTASQVSSMSSTAITNTTAVVEKLKKIYDDTDAVNRELLVEITKLTTSLSELINNIKSTATAGAATGAAADSTNLFNTGESTDSNNIFGTSTQNNANENAYPENNTENMNNVENNNAEYNNYGSQYPMNNEYGYENNQNTGAYGQQYSQYAYQPGQGYASSYYPASYGYYGAGGTRRKTLSARKSISNRKTRHATHK